MKTARNRFGVSILVGLAVALLLSAQPAAASRSIRESMLSAPTALGGAEGFDIVDSLDVTVSTRAQLAVGLGAGVPLLLFAWMVRRRVQADM